MGRHLIRPHLPSRLFPLKSSKAGRIRLATDLSRMGHFWIRDLMTGIKIQRRYVVPRRDRMYVAHPGPYKHGSSRQRRAPNTSPFWTSILGQDSRYPLSSRRSLFSVSSTPAPQYIREGEASTVGVPLLLPNPDKTSTDPATEAGYTMDPEKKKRLVFG